MAASPDRYWQFIGSCGLITLMQPHPLRSQAAVSGIGVTAFGAISGYTALDFGAWALREALLDANLSAGDIDGLVVMRIPEVVKFGEATGLRPRLALQLPAAGRMTGVAIQYACMAIATGQATRVACVYGNDGKSAGATYGGSEATYAGGVLSAPYGMTSPGAFHAIMYSRYMAETGATRAHLAEIAVAFRSHALLNPAAVMRKPITAADHEAARPIAAPLHLLDYCLINDGGVCMILEKSESARERRVRTVHIRGAAQSAHLQQSSFPPDDYWREAMGRAGAESLAQAQLSLADMSGLMLYDNFTPSVLFQLEGFGYCEPGTAWREIQDGSLRLGGRWQANTSGGHLSESYMQGWALNVEAVRQLRGEAGARQMANLQFIHVMTASPQCSSIIYGLEA
jgi:acetyl-CoA acetyltransferase